MTRRCLYRVFAVLALLGLLASTGCGSFLGRYVDPRTGRPLTRAERLFREAEHRAQEGKAAEALLAYRQAYQADPSYAPALARLAAAYAAQGRRRSAAHFYERYLALAPQDVESQQALLDLYASLGDTERIEALRSRLRLEAAPVDERPSAGGPPLRWATFLEERTISGLAAAEGTLFATTQGGSLFALDSASGQERWRFTATGAAVSAPAYSPRGPQPLVLFGSEDGYLYAVAASDGSEVWRFQAQGPIFGAPAAGGEAVFFGSTDGNLYAVRLSDGTRLWTFGAGEPIHAAPLVAGDTVYVGSLDHSLYAIDAATGAQRWRFTALAAVESTPTLAHGHLYFGANDSRLYCLDPRTGAELWHYSTGDAIYASAVPGADSLFVASASHDLYALSPDDGELLWRHQGQSFLTVTPAFDGTALYFVATADPNLYALNASTGQLLWQVDTGDWPGSAPLLVGKDLYLGEKDGTVLAYRLPQSSADGRA
ncbi:MAG: PQQ-binding-like beta-propeller repeat protein, partial [Anaerolineae bacterium]|nr:PQQ-binding-like beta-propeller repeat protein [Anaerolineae bacterium]